MGTSPAKLELLIADIESVDDRMVRAEILTELGNSYQEVPAAVAHRPFSQEHKVTACQSDAYVWVVMSDQGLCFPYFAVENPQGLSAKALASLLTQGCSGVTAQEISAVSDGIVARVFGSTISMGKAEGLMNMVRLMRRLAHEAEQKVAV